MKSLFRSSLFLVAIAIVFVRASAFAGAVTDPGVYPATDREAARTWFNLYWPQTVPPYLITYANGPRAITGFTGDVAKNVPGTISQAWKDEALLRLNMLRRMAGESPGTFDPVLNQQAQAGAMLMAQNNNYSHYPPKTWLFWNQTAADALAVSDIGGDPGATGILG